MMSRRAVVVGSNGPESAGALQYARRDAERMAKVLKHARCGFDVVKPSRSRDPQQVERCIAEAAELCVEGDTFIVFFSGHGIIEGGNLILMLDQTDLRRPL